MIRYAFFLHPASKLSVVQAEARLKDHYLATRSSPEGLWEELKNEGLFYGRIDVSTPSMDFQRYADDLGVEVHVTTVVL